MACADIILRPLSMSAKASRDPNQLPLNDAEWDQRVESAGKKHILHNLPRRAKRRPQVFGLVPHRQIEDIERVGSDQQKVRRRKNEESVLEIMNAGFSFADINHDGLLLAIPPPLSQIGNRSSLGVLG
jgi:hypothetical protein